MIIAQEKRKQNIIEYILYMFQVEDTIRACQFDMGMIEERIISQFKVSEDVQTEVKSWYANLIVTMHEEGVKESGHISELNAMVDQLNALHLKLLNEVKDQKYRDQYAFAQQNIQEFEKKMGTSSRNEISTCMQAIYALLLLRLQKKDITQETIEAMQTFSNLLALLGGWFMKTAD